MSKTTYFLLIIMVISLLTGCVIQKQKTEFVQMNIAGKKVVMIVPPEDFRDEELFEPLGLLRQGGAEVTIASKGVQAATGLKGGSVDVALDLVQVTVAEFDAVVFIGGTGAAVFKDDAEAHRIARESVAQGKILGAICIAPGILANAGVLEGRKATSFISESETLKEKGADYTGQGVTIDGKILTAAGPEFASEFGIELVKLLSAS